MMDKNFLTNKDIEALEKLIAFYRYAPLSELNKGDRNENFSR